MSKMNEPDANPDTTIPVVSGRENQDMTEVRAQVEAERVSRRQALRKFGFGAGLAALMALSADDLARMAAKKLEQYASDNKTAHKIAEEFKNAGIALAAPSRPLCALCTSTSVGGAITYCGIGYCEQRKACVKTMCSTGDLTAFWRCLDRAKASYSTCTSSGTLTPECTANPVDCNCNQTETC